MSDTWGPAKSIIGGINIGGVLFGPSISRDNLTFFFSTDSHNILRGGRDIYLSTRRNATDRWSTPVNLGDAINGPESEDWAYLDADRSTLYFTRYPNNVSNGSELWQASLLPFDNVHLSGSGEQYTQDFDSLGTSTMTAGTRLAMGWTFTANDVVFNNVTTREFPPASKNYAGLFNAGSEGAADRSLVTEATRNEVGELDFCTLVTDDKVQALRLGFDVEAWQLRSGLGANAGEAAFHVVLEADSGNGFQQVADLGEFSTGKTLVRPATGNLVDGNDPAYRRSFDTGPVDVGSVPAGATLRTRWIGTAGSRNVVFGLDNVSLRFAAPGDANIDGVFNSGDLVHVFQIGEYEDVIAGNSTWSDGDWTNDNEFDSGDLVRAFQEGNYVNATVPTTPTVPEPNSCVLLLMGCAAFGLGRKRTGFSELR